MLSLSQRPMRRDEEAKFKLCKVRLSSVWKQGYSIHQHIQWKDRSLSGPTTPSNWIVDLIKFDVGNVVMVTGGRNRGRRVGILKNREKHKARYPIGNYLIMIIIFLLCMTTS
ncbi:hypothetical protein ACP275_04G146700 [Erythranthe tilingii]